ncbi:thioredoxin family protein [candidate division KSB1 bacterium]|nr:thioredoxin family protein [candidate division KSB1 bacterium]MBL7094842.1 thioredoxin family protein [candidate division KSB1 bacterium]
MRNKTFILLFILLMTFSLSQQVFSQDPFDVKILTVSGKLSQTQVKPGASVDIEVTANIEHEFHINANKPSEEYLIPTVLKFEPIENATFGEINYPKPKMAKFSFSESAIAVYEGTAKFTAELKLNSALQTGKNVVKGTLSFQGCNDVNCFAPQDVSFEIPFEVVSAGEAGKQVLETQSTIRDVATETGGDLETKEIVKQESPETDVKFTADELRAKKILEKGLPYAILAFFLFGLALNLTPCVYPVIPLTVGYFGGQSDKKKGAAFVMALFYVVGIAIVFAGLGLISGLAGKQWGFLFQNPWFVVVVTVIILAMAASMFGAFEITVPAGLMSKLGKSREGNIGALIMGLTVGIVIAPCAAGIIIGLVGLVAKMGIVLKGTMLFFIMGLGLGMPYLFLATFSGLLNKLPQSGMWMVWVRKLFGVLLIGVALYFFLPQAKHIYDQQGFFFGLLAIFGGLLLGFLDHAPGYTKGFKIGRGIFGILMIALGIMLVHGAINAKPSAINWIHYEEGTVAELQEEGKPVFLDFYADWCAPCKEMDRKTFKEERVVELAKQFTMIKIDCTAPSESVKNFMKKHEASGMPTFIFIDKDEKEVNELREIGFVPADKFLGKMQKLLEYTR